MFQLVVTKKGFVYVDSSIKKKFYQRMQDLNWTYKKVGELIGMDQRNVSNYMRPEGNYQRPMSLAMALRIGEALGLEMFLEIDILE